MTDFLPPDPETWVLRADTVWDDQPTRWWVDRWDGIYYGLDSAIEHVTLPNRVEPLP